jgi:[acyl-carrier-protein] S-malonyltransferase
MGRDLYEAFPAAKAVFDQADKSLGFVISRLCFDGPEVDLRETINAQPAILTASYAAREAARAVAGARLPSPAFVAGHSLGEYTALAALAAAGVIDFATAVRLARERGRLMYEAGVVKPGGMTAIIGFDENTLAEVCRETGAWVVNINCPGQLVVSGAREAVAKAGELSKARGAARVIPLQVSGAFHTPLMQSAVDGMSKIIANLSFKDPAVPIIANTTAQPLTTAAAIKEELINQLCHCVQWQRSVEYMVSQGVTTFIEIDPGKMLTGLIRRITKDVQTLNLGDAVAIKNLANPSA